METYDLSQNHIVTPPEEIALSTNQLQVYYGSGSRASMTDASLSFPAFRLLP